MENTDTIKLLMECDAGSKMAVSSIDEVLEKTSSTALKRLLDENKQEHTRLGNEIHEMLNQQGAQDKDPPLMAKGMSWLKTNLKMGMEPGDAAVAELITDGCNMGIKSLHEYLNEYQAADAPAKALCLKLAELEERLCKSLQPYL